MYLVVTVVEHIMSRWSQLEAFLDKFSQKISENHHKKSNILNFEWEEQV
jgi:hypothetical protein